MLEEVATVGLPGFGATAPASRWEMFGAATPVGGLFPSRLGVLRGFRAWKINEAIRYRAEFPQPKQEHKGREVQRTRKRRVRRRWQHGARRAGGLSKASSRQTEVRRLFVACDEGGRPSTHKR